jgi:CheY-like chemotaxis protein
LSSASLFIASKRDIPMSATFRREGALLSQAPTRARPILSRTGVRFAFGLLSLAPEMTNGLPPSSAMRVFVADDDDAMREAVTVCLRAEGHDVVEARDGAELVDLLQDAVGSLRPDVVVTDVRMPNLSGLGVLAALQRAKWTVPVLLITALVDESVHTVARRMGAIGVLRKPFETHDLLMAVAKAGALLERPPSSRPPR